MTSELRLLTIKNHIDTLTGSFRGVRAPVDVSVPEEMFRNREFTRIVRWVRDVFQLRDLPLRIGYVNHGGNNDAVAWVANLEQLPLYGSAQLQHCRVNVFIRKEYLHEAPFLSVLSTIAHEMSHVVLYALRHPLRESEIATDLTAMVLGFAEVFNTGRQLYMVNSFLTGMRNATSLTEYLCGMEGMQKITGYLDPEELTYALCLIRNKR